MNIRSRVKKTSLLSFFRQKSNNKNSIVSISENAIQKIGKENPWKPVRTQKGELYYHNQLTDETTAIGEKQPIPWIKVNTNEGHYWWRTDTNQTTALGATQPPRHDIQHWTKSQQQISYQPQTFGKSMISYATLGFGMSMGIMLVSALLR